MSRIQFFSSRPLCRRGSPCFCARFPPRFRRVSSEFTSSIWAVRSVVSLLIEPFVNRLEPYTPATPICSKYNRAGCTPYTLPYVDLSNFNLGERGLAMSPSIGCVVRVARVPEGASAQSLSRRHVQWETGAERSSPPSRPPEYPTVFSLFLNARPLYCVGLFLEHLIVVGA